MASCILLIPFSIRTDLIPIFVSRCSKVLQRKSKTPGKLCDSDSLPSSFLLIFFLLTHRHGHTKWATIIKNLVVVGFSRNVSVRCNLYSSMLSASMAMQWENEGRRQHNGIWKVPISVWPERSPLHSFNNADTLLYACAHTRDPMERASNVAICLCASLSGRVGLNMHWGKRLKSHKQLC